MGHSAGTLGPHMINGAAPTALDFKVYRLSLGQKAVAMAATYGGSHFILSFGLPPDITSPV